MTNADAKSIVKELDFAGNKKINYSEFLSACINLDEILKDDDRTKALYNQFDVNGTGRINREDVEKSLGVMGRDISNQEIKDFMERYGETDGSGVIFENFKLFLKEG